jgi:hypothetical protein
MSKYEHGHREEIFSTASPPCDGRWTSSASSDSLNHAMRSDGRWTSSASSRSDGLREYVKSEHGLVDAIDLSLKSGAPIRLRADDLWCALSVKITRSVSDNSKKQFYVKSSTIDQAIIQLAKLVSELSETRPLRDWIEPDFSTTTDKDRVVSSLIYLSAFPNYEYEIDTSNNMERVSSTANLEIPRHDDWTVFKKKIDRLHDTILTSIADSIIDSTKSFDAASKQFWCDIQNWIAHFDQTPVIVKIRVDGVSREFKAGILGYSQNRYERSIKIVNRFEINCL